MEHTEAAQRLGMKDREIVAVVETADGHVVTTHDGSRTLITADDELVFNVAEPVEAKPAPKKATAKKG